MAAHDTKMITDLDLAGAQALQIIDAWRRVGSEEYSGQGLAFCHQVGAAVFQYLAAYRFIGRHEKQEQIDALWATVQTSPHGFAALDIPQDEIMTTALTLGLTMIHAQQRQQRGEVTVDAITLDGTIREAAKLSGVLTGGAPSAYVATLARMTDAEMEDAARLANLFRNPAAGSA